MRPTHRTLIWLFAVTLISTRCSSPPTEPSSPSPSPLGGSVSETPPQPSISSAPDTRMFTDPVYSYSVRVPSDWRINPEEIDKKRNQRLSLVTPQKNIFLVSIDRLPEAVTSQSEFETIGQSYLDPIIERYVKAVSLLEGPRNTEDKSDQNSMRFWQGTSTLQAALISLHAVPFGSDVMVNLVYVCYSPQGQETLDEVKALDNVMASLSFDVRKQ